MRPFTFLPLGLAFALLGCGHRTEQYVLPNQVTDFDALYESNCAGCHGSNGRYGAAGPLNDAIYLALVGKNRLKDVIAQGVPRTAMPAFAQTYGGALTDQQVDILAGQMVTRWSQPLDPSTGPFPPYSAELGDPNRGEQVFHNSCAKCHDAKGSGGSVTDASFLALVSNQSLRTTTIAGRSDRGMPNWGKQNPEHPLTPDDVSDVVAWMSLQRGGSNR